MSKTLVTFCIWGIIVTHDSGKANKPRIKDPVMNQSVFDGSFHGWVLLPLLNSALGKMQQKNPALSSFRTIRGRGNFQLPALATQCHVVFPLGCPGQPHGQDDDWIYQRVIFHPKQNYIYCVVVEPTQLKHIRQLGSFPKPEVKIEKIEN